MKNKYLQLLKELKGLNQYQFNNFISASQYYYLYDIILKYCKQNENILDWGCGEGHFSYFLVKNHFKVNAFSLEDCLLKDKLENDFKNRFKFLRSSDLINLPYKHNCFNSVISVGVFEHVESCGGDEIKSLKEINRVLLKNGYFICYHLPNRYSWIEFIVRFIKNQYSHERKYLKREIKYLFNGTGFKIVLCKRYGFLPRLITKKLPRFLNSSILFMKFFNITDKILSVLFSIFCQNYIVVAKKI